MSAIEEYQPDLDQTSTTMPGEGVATIEADIDAMTADMDSGAIQGLMPGEEPSSLPMEATDTMGEQDLDGDDMGESLMDLMPNEPVTGEPEAKSAAEITGTFRLILTPA